LEQSETTINKHHLFAEMIAHSWFTVNYFHVSFGKQDQLQQAIEAIKQTEALTIDANQSYIFDRLASTGNKHSLRVLRYFNSEVPHRFLSPWFPAENKDQAYQSSRTLTNNCPYALYDDVITINPLWVTYFQKNAGILKAFCY
jgi:hypothetical protein